MKLWRSLVGFIHRVAYAALITFAVWFLWTQIGHNEPDERLLMRHARLAIPIYVALFYLPRRRDVDHSAVA